MSAELVVVGRTFDGVMVGAVAKVSGGAVAVAVGVTVYIP
jgi:hypothetical protein